MWIIPNTFIICESKFNHLYEEKANDIRIRNKSKMFFLNLEKIWAHQNKIRNILKNETEITDQNKFSNELFYSYENL